MRFATDHTKEVEQRVVAISIKATDDCGFFESCDAPLIPKRECWYCIHGEFPRNTSDPHQIGLCKFRK